MINSSANLHYLSFDQKQIKNTYIQYSIFLEKEAKVEKNW